ncbi:hypothetical protein [Paenibacillus piri]|uniref:Uncharacterized protein n=1 Tax=Paenibacillus piri TaxID=2547395 RepID=A0A4R5KXT2_9BACL|nr:hypothetical protein [Paenibacillus piri]TDG00890.1 hypothetical protein E1757_04570 [Paenibacillus piri]
MDRYTVAVDVEKTDDNVYSARRMIVCHPVETEEEFKATFSQKISKVALNSKGIEGLLPNPLVLKDGTRISKAWNIEFKEPKSYEEAERFVNILQRFLEFMRGSSLNLENIIFSTEDERSIESIFPEPVFKQLSVPSRDMIQRMFASAQIDNDEQTSVTVILGVWTQFFIETAHHAFLESMPDVMRPYEHEAKNKIISDRFDFLTGMIKFVLPEIVKDNNGNDKSAGRLLKELLEPPTRATRLEHRGKREIIERCKNLRNLVVHKLRDSNSKTDISEKDYDIFETFFYQNFSHLMIQSLKVSQEDNSIKGA